MSKQPNILFVMTDQQRSDTVHALGNRQIRTPILDSLIQSGTAFTNCYSPSPVCVAARSATITGVPPHLNGCASNNDSPLGMQSIMQVLQAAGTVAGAWSLLRAVVRFARNSMNRSRGFLSTS